MSRECPLGQEVLVALVERADHGLLLDLLCRDDDQLERLGAAVRHRHIDGACFDAVELHSGAGLTYRHSSSW